MNARGVAMCLMLGIVSAAAAERPAGKADDDFVPPQLVSRTGGGPRWTSFADVQRDAEKGVPAAQLELAQCYETGREVPQNTAKAIELYEQAAKGGEANGWFRLGKIFSDGLGVPSDRPRAFEYYRKGAFAGVSEAQYNVGAMLVSARGVPRDWVEGLAWLIVATKNGAAPEGEKQVRAQMAKRPADIAAAERRAEELLPQITLPKLALEPGPTLPEKFPATRPAPRKVLIRPPPPSVRIKMPPPQPLPQ